MTQIEREEEQLGRELDEGRITRKEYNHEMLELQRDYAAQAREAACEAYDRELESW